MAGGVSIKISGNAELLARLRNYPKQVVEKASMAGVYAVGNALVAKALPLTPKLQGPLRASLKCTLPVMEGARATVQVGAGGAALQYAAAQHQGFIERNGKRIVFQHYTEPGTGPLFLDKAAEALRHDATRIFNTAFKAMLARDGKGGLPTPSEGGGGGGGESGNHHGARGGKKTRGRK